MSSKPNLAEGIPTVVGLDIGSSVSKIAVVTKGAVEIITNEANFRHTPTVVGYGKAERYIGEAGSAKIKSNVANTIIAPHRFLGWTKS